MLLLLSVCGRSRHNGASVEFFLAKKHGGQVLERRHDAEDEIPEGRGMDKRMQLTHQY